MSDKAWIKFTLCEGYSVMTVWPGFQQSVIYSEINMHIYMGIYYIGSGRKLKRHGCCGGDSSSASEWIILLLIDDGTAFMSLLAHTNQLF